MNLEEAKKDVSFFIRRAYEKGLTTSTGGNFSSRIGTVMVITPSGLDKARVKEADCAVVEIDTGKNLTPEKKLSIETEMHRRVYLCRPDVFSVAHAHPTFSCLFCALEDKINTKLIAESWYLLGDVIKIPYRLMGSVELAKIVGEYAENGSNAFLLENHGALTFGKTMLNAFDRLECLEQAAKLTYLLRDNVPVQITEDELKKIENMR